VRRGCRLQGRGAVQEWQLIACRRSPSRRERDVARSGCMPEAFPSYEMRSPAGIERGVVSMGGKAKAQGRGKGWGAVACHLRHVVQGFVHVILLSVPMKEVAGEFLFYIVIYMNFYLFYFICFLAENKFNISFFSHIWRTSHADIQSQIGHYKNRHPIWLDVVKRPWRPIGIRRSQKASDLRSVNELMNEVRSRNPARVLKRVGLHTNNAISTWNMSVFHQLQTNKQRNQSCSLCEARWEKTRKLQTQWLHGVSKSDNKSNHHHDNVESVRDSSVRDISGLALVT